MNVDWYCLISSTKSVEPTEKDGELYLTEGNSVMGTWGEFSTETALKTLDGKSGISLSNPEHCTGNSANVGSMAILKYSITFLQTPKNITLFRPRSGALRIIPPFPTGPMTFSNKSCDRIKGTGRI